MRRTLLALIVVLFLSRAASAGITAATCARASGNGGAQCLRDYADTLAACRLHDDTACEMAARAPGGPLETILDATGEAAAARCNEATADTLGYLGIEDLGFRVPEACADFGEDLIGIGFADSAMPAFVDCQGIVGHALDKLRNAVVRAYGPGCYVPQLGGGRCKRPRRDNVVAHATGGARRKILMRCEAAFDALELVPLDAAPDVGSRVDALLALVVQRARHFAQRVYPPNDLGPTAEFGPFPVGVTTLALEDPSRQNVAGTGPRPVTVELYYPSTAAAVAGVPEDIVNVLGIDIVTTPAFRDVARAPGTFPLVLFSHGNGGIRFQSFFFAAHLASHGFVVASPDHHGNTFVDALRNIIDPDVATNRPLDMSFLLDTLLATDPGLDSARIGVSGHSFGGYTAFAVAGGAFALGTFTDPRVKAIMPQAPASSVFPASFFDAIHIPTLIVGGSIDETTPFPEEQQRAFDLLPAGAAVVGLAQLTDAGHFTFSDFCEVPRNLLAFLGGFDEACEPRHLPWRHAHDIVNFLSLNFFDGVLNGNPDALARLAPANLAAIEDLVYESK
ncbi:MAG TPA: prolyl oligopeptidase family serine peptidase [Candidatus Binatia bacterium]|nr:prolyl oligopeptidase family serine peptidase [Candidatus Binatia bacterium]